MNTRTQRRSLALALVAALAVVAVLSACSGSQGTGSNVTIRDLRFNPPELTVNTGTTVTWTNQDQTAHTVTSDSFGSTSTPAAEQFTSPPLNPGQSFHHTFDTPGTYKYHCDIHQYLKGEVVVK